MMVDGIAKQLTKHIVLTFFVSTLLFFVWMPVPQVSAEGTPQPKCDCFCATVKGAIPPGNGSMDTALMTTSECQTACKAKGNTVAVCAFDPKFYPSEDVSCFSQELCEKAVKNYCGESTAGAPATDETISCLAGSLKDTFDIGYQPPGCLPGQHFCYAPKNSTRVKLNVQIGETSFVNDLEKYVSVVYQWMVTAGITFAIVLIMIGGLQYTLGAASQDQIKKGKDRMKNAVIGLILLLSAIMIIETVSPKLSSISVPRLPMIKTRELAGQGKSCEILADVDKFQIGVQTAGSDSSAAIYKGQHSSTFQCGKTGVIRKGPDDAEVVAGLTCQFRWCENQDKVGATTQRCMGSGPSAKCLQCEQIYDDSPDLKGTGITPSSATCGQFTQPTTTTKDGKVDTIRRCGWTKDADLTNDVGVIKADSAGGCGYFEIDCKKITKCENYAAVVVSNIAEGDNRLWEINTEPEEWAGCVGTCADFSFKMICEEDPCQLESRGCKYDDVNDLEPHERCTSYFKEEGIGDAVGDWVDQNIKNPIIDAVGL